MLYDPEEAAPRLRLLLLLIACSTSFGVLNSACPLAYAGLALVLGVPDEAAARKLWTPPFLFGAVAAITAVSAQFMWRRWSPADPPVHRARARAADLPILRVRLVQVWALDPLAGASATRTRLSRPPETDAARS